MAQRPLTAPAAPRRTARPRAQLGTRPSRDVASPEHGLPSIGPADPTLHDQIYQRVKRALMSGQFEPGHALSMRTLARAFDTSMMPVRDALKRLTAEGALSALPSRSACVPVVSRGRFQEILELRLLLEPRLAAKAAGRIALAQIDELVKYNDAMSRGRASGDVAQYLDANRSFHFLLYEAADASVSMPIVESLWMQGGAMLRWMFSEEGIRHADHHHLQALKALRRGDAEATSKSIFDDIADAADRILIRYPFAR